MLSISINNLSAFSFKSLIPSSLRTKFYKEQDEGLCKRYGKEEASEQYKEKIYEFLTYLDVENTRDVPIRKLKKGKSSLALADITGIWLNEETTFSGGLDSYQLYILAHEAAHYAHHHSIKCLIFKSLAGLIPTNLLQTLIIFLSYRVIASSQNISDLLSASLISNIYLKTIENIIAEKITPFINNTYDKSDEKQADLKAAEMLCKHGYEYVIEDMIKRIKNNIEQGITVSNFHDHPSFEEQLAYFQKFWDEWQQENEKAARG